jgi:hypothetical protein
MLETFFADSAWLILCGPVYLQSLYYTGASCIKLLITFLITIL